MQLLNVIPVAIVLGSQSGSALRLQRDETLLLALLVNERLVDVGNNTTTSNGSLNQGV